MEVITCIADTLVRLLWDRVAKNVKTIKGLKSNVKALNEAMDQLNVAKLDVARKVQLAEESQMVLMEQVGSWIQRIESLEKEVNNVSEEAEEELKRSCWSCCPNSCWSRHNLGKEVKKKLKTINAIKNEGKFDVVADQMPRGPVDERPLEANIGLDLTFEEVRGWIMDSQVKKIGVYGMGGVGKTTLLTKINNDLANISYGFDFVIWVVVSKESNVEKVQEAICERLNHPKDTWKDKSEDQKSMLIYRALRKKKFVILLDDMWKRLDLTKVGIPTSYDQMYKIVFTTRSNEVCGQMGADRKIEIRCLATEQALELFKINVGLSTLNAHPTIPKLAEIFAEECKGLPLALVVVGRAMASKTNPTDWDKALIKLRKDPSTIMGMDEEVFHILKFSYDNLCNDTMRSCFTYCCIYPEDYEIKIDDLLNLWIAEGFLDEFYDIHEARDRGIEIVEDLKSASLLEKGKPEGSVKMHDVIRDLALWISRDCKGKVHNYMVVDTVELLEGQMGTSLTAAEKISLWGGSSFSGIPNIHSWSNVSTFIVRYTKIKMFPSRLVQLMHAIKVLDLSHNHHLTTLPSTIGELVKLEFLNITNTGIVELPIELKKLVKMKYLLLYEMKVIPRKLISSFSLLRVFRAQISGLIYDDSDEREDNILSGGGGELLKELESLEHLTDLDIGLIDSVSVDKLQHASKLQNCLSSLLLGALGGDTSVQLSSSFFKGLRNLDDLFIAFCETLTINCEPIDGHGFPSAYFNRLRKVTILKCKSLMHLTWIAYAPTLEYLNVTHCESMVEIVNVAVGADCSIFSRLKIMHLLNLPSLHSIYPAPLSFSSLVEMSVYSCPHLKRLPFDPSSAKGTLKKIEGKREWWDQLQWDDHTCDRLFRPFLVDDGVWL